MKNLIKLFVCLTLVIVSMFAVINSNTNKAISVDADSNLVAIKDDSGNTVTYRNTSDPIMRLKEYNYPTQNLRACWVSNFIGSLPSYSTAEKWKTDEVPGDRAAPKVHGQPQLRIKIPPPAGGGKPF